MGSGFPESSGSGRRCARHALASGPDGQCALCRSESLPPARAYPTWVLGGLLLAILLVSGVAVAYRAASSFAHAAIAQEPPTKLGPSVPSEVSARSSEGSEEEPLLREPEAAEAGPELADEPPTLAGEASPPSAVVPTGAPSPSPPPPPPAAVPAAPMAENRAAATRPPPTEAELRAALSATPIVMYSASWCGVCRKAKQFLAANGLRYQEIDADTTPGSWEKIEQLSGRRGVPLIIVDGEQTPPGLSPSNIMRAASRSVERRLGVQGIQFKLN